MNTDGRAALAYHEATKHSLDSVRRDTRGLDWDNQPRPYKLYADLEGLTLPREFLSSDVPALSAIAPDEVERTQPRVPDLATLATVLYYSAGITKHLRYPGGLMAFRAAACTGALYHIELYIVCGDLPDLPAGVYQFGVHDFALRQLRAGDFRATLVEASGGEPAVADGPATIVCTSTFWRNAWKYQARAYRHAFWDNGTILANLLAVAAAHRLPARVVVGFADEQVNHLIGVDGEHEAAISLVTLGHVPDSRPTSAPSMAPISPPTVPLSAREVDYPPIREMHASSSLQSAAEVAAWRQSLASVLVELVEEPRDVIPLRPIAAESLPGDAIERVIQRRGSSRRFERSAIGYDALSTIMAQATRGVPADFIAPGTTLADPYLIVNAVDGLESGTYLYDRRGAGVQLLQAGDFRDVASYLALTQPIAGDAAVNVYFLADLAPILARLGNRGYRAAQLDASVTAGRMYLAAYALGLGATGLTFFDDDVTSFFSPNAEGKSVMFLIALGNPARRRPT